MLGLVVQQQNIKVNVKVQKKVQLKINKSFNENNKKIYINFFPRSEFRRQFHHQLPNNK